MKRIRKLLLFNLHSYEVIKMVRGCQEKRGEYGKEGESS